jgi:hypothetical protein
LYQDEQANHPGDANATVAPSDGPVMITFPYRSAREPLRPHRAATVSAGGTTATR